VSIRVFLVEDAKHMRGVLEDLLGVIGSFEIVANRATEAEANLWLDEHARGCDLALIDLILEQGTGMGVIARAKASSPDAQVVVLSDYATAGIRRHCLKLGADAVFQKSQEMREFMDFCAGLASREPAGA
jgi:DNA-binding NarL/FixJ family response regulator